MSEQTTQTPAAQEVNPFAIFSTNIEDIKSFEETTGTDWTSIFYEPSPEEGKAYVAAIKFLPNIYNAVNPLVQKSFYKLVNPDNGKVLYYDSPSSIGEQCVAVNEWSRLFNSEDARDKELAKKYKRTRQKCGVIQIIKDPQNPALDGQLRLLRMQLDGDIDNSIKSKMKPTKEELALDDTLKPVDVFNPFASPYMKLKVTLSKLKVASAKGGEVEISARDFAGSTWSDNNVGMVIDGKAITIEDAANVEIQKKIVELLKQDHINIVDHFQYKPAEPARMELIKRAIQKMSNAPIDVAPAADTQADQTKVDVAAPAAGSAEPTPVAETKAPEPVVTAPSTDAQKNDVFESLGI